MDLSVVIPSLNEGPNLRCLLPLLRESLTGLGISSEIIVVEGASTDETPRIAEDAGARYLRELAPGYGAAIRRGLSEAKGTYVLTMDADLSHPADFVGRMWAAREQADIVIASRYVQGGKACQPWLRLALSRILNGLFRSGLSFPVRDMSSGFRLYRRQLFASLDLQYSNFVVLVEILLKAHQRGMQIHEVPFHYRPRITGRSHARIVRFGWDYLRLFCRMWRLRRSLGLPSS